jgi:hypothetical protein
MAGSGWGLFCLYQFPEIDPTEHTFISPNMRTFGGQHLQCEQKTPVTDWVDI